MTVGSREREIECAAFFWVGKLDGGEVGVGLCLHGDDVSTERVRGQRGDGKFTCSDTTIMLDDSPRREQTSFMNGRPTPCIGV